jgi:hypothetical protein
MVNIEKQCCVCRSGIRCFFEPWTWDGKKFGPGSGSGIGKNPDPESGYGMNTPDNFSGSLETVFWVKKS